MPDATAIAIALHQVSSSAVWPWLVCLVAALVVAPTVMWVLLHPESDPVELDPHYLGDQ
jgi:hypothetical protein